MKGSNWIVFAEDVDSFSVIAAANVRYMTGESRECVIQLVTQLLLNTSSDDVQEDEMCVQSVVAIMRLIVALYNRNKDFIAEDVILRCFSIPFSKPSLQRYSPSPKRKGLEYCKCFPSRTRRMTSSSCPSFRSSSPPSPLLRHLSSSPLCITNCCGSRHYTPFTPRSPTSRPAFSSTQKNPAPLLLFLTGGTARTLLSWMTPISPSQEAS